MKQSGRMAGLALAISFAVWPAFAADAPPPDIPATIPVVMLVDLGSNQPLYLRAPERRFLPASVTKVMTALVAFELIQAGKLREDALLAVRPETAAKWSGKGSSMNLAADSRVAVRDLLTGITTISANDAAVVLAEGAGGSVEGWVKAMNTTAQRIGMTDSRFATPNGWPDGGRTVVSARDLVRLTDALVNSHPELYRRYFGKPSFAWAGQRHVNRDPTIGIVPGADGIKTGHTTEAGFNFLGSAARGGRRLVVVIGGAPREDLRAWASRELLEWGFAAWETRPLLRAGQQIGEAQVQLGDSRHVALIAPREFTLALPKGTTPRITARIRYAGPLRAPIRKGALVAALEVSIAGQPPHFVPLAAGSAVDTAGPVDRLVNGVMGLFG